MVVTEPEFHARLKVLYNEATELTPADNTRLDMDSIFGDNYTKLEKPYYIRDLAATDRLSDGTKRCRICQEVKNLAEFRMINSTGKSWPNYACKPCSKELQREAYRRKSK